MGLAFITGGSSGIGLAMAKSLALDGHNLALFARRLQPLSDAAEDIERATGAKVTCHQVDVGDPEKMRQAVENAVARHGAAPTWAIANAGIAEPGLFRDQALDRFDAQMRTNYLGALYFAKAVTLHMKTGHLVFVSSGAALFGIYGYSAYAPTKFAMRGLAEVLRVELAPDIAVTLAYPPDTDTPQYVAENQTKPKVTKEITAGAGLLPPEKVADIILARAERGKFTAAPGFQMKALLLLHSVLGPILRRWQIGLARKHK